MNAEERKAQGERLADWFDLSPTQLERNLDVFEVMDAYDALQRHIDLRRWREYPDVKQAIDRAREAALIAANSPGKPHGPNGTQGGRHDRHR